MVTPVREAGGLIVPSVFISTTDVEVEELSSIDREEEFSVLSVSLALVFPTYSLSSVFSEILLAISLALGKSP